MAVGSIYRSADLAGSFVHASSASATAASLTVTPITWNVVGLDSNSPATGPNRFPVGARVCNTGSSVLSDVTANFIWDSANANINLRSGSLSSISLGSIGVGNCADAYFEAEINRVAAAYNTTRAYHISAADSGSGATDATPLARELFVEHLISQNRNGITTVKLNGTPIAAGGSMTLVVGNTYNIELDGYTATQGYNQLEGFINFPNTIFQVLAVNTTYSANTSPYVTSPSPMLYANACLWDDDINDPNYRSCIGGDGKAGGTVITTYTVKILSGAGTSQTLNTLLDDFSGSSFHYNADFSAGARIANIVGPGSVTINKTFTPKAISPGGTSALTFKLSNPTSESFSGVNFADAFPAGLVVANTPGVSYSGCGAGSFTPTPLAGATSLTFANATLAPNSNCVVSVNVTAASAGTYVNTTGDLFINSSIDTGNFGQDTLVASSAAACTPGQSLATWTLPTSGQGSGGPPPPFSTISARVSTATASVSTGMTNSIVTTGNPTNAWAGQGFAKSTVPTADTAPYFQFAVDTSNYSGVAMSLDISRDTNWGGGGNIPTVYIYSSTTGAVGSFTLVNTISGANLPSNWQTVSNISAAATSSGTTYFRINAMGTNSVSSSQLFLDNVSFTGCALAPAAPTLSKSFSPTQIVKNSNSTLSFTLNNTAGGNQALTGVAFTDVLPAGLSIADSSSSQCGGTVTSTAATRTIALTGGSLAAGGNCTFNVTVTGSTEGNYSNVTGFVSTNELGTTTSYATAPLNVVAPPSLGKAFSPLSIQTGQTSTLSFTISNPNQSNSLSGISFSDPLPAGVAVATSGPTSVCGGTFSTTAPSSVSFSGGSLAANGSCSFSVPVAGSTSGTKLNTTSVTNSTEGGPGNAASATLVVNDSTAEVDLNKQVSTDGVNWTKFAPVVSSGSIYYRFALYNGGDVPLTTLSVNDPALAGTGVDPSGCLWSLPLAVGDTAYCVKGTVSAVVGSHTNTATASANYSTGSTISGPSSAIYATTGLTIAKSSQETYFTAAGNVLHYNYLVTNTGAAPLLGPVTISDDKSSDAACPAVNTVGDLDDWLDPGENITCSGTYVVQPADVTAGQITNLASATASGVTSNTASKMLSLPVDLSISKTSSPKPYVAGNTFRYNIVVTNNGPNNVTGAQVTDVLPAALSGFSWTCTAYGAGASCGTPGPVVGNINASVDLPVATQAVFAVTGVLPGGTTGTLTNTATVTPPAGIIDVVPGNNSATDNNPAGASADLAIAKTSAPKPYVAGSPLSYTITVTNNGPADVVGAAVRDIIPADLSGVSWTSSATGSASITSGGSGSGNDLSATVNVAFGAANSVTFTVTGSVLGATTAAIVNTATVEAPSTISDPVPGNNTATDVNGSAQQADLAITKVSSPNPYVLGAPLTYTVVVANNGPSDANGARVQDRFPSQLSGFSWVCLATGAGACLQSNGVGDIDTLVNLPVGSQATFTVSGTVPVTTAGTLVNTASVEPPPFMLDQIMTNNSATSPTSPPVTAASVTIEGRVMQANGVGVSNAVVRITDRNGNSRSSRTTSFGYYHFDNVMSGETYIVAASSKRKRFAARVINVFDAISDLDFIARE
jgi:conserved repeat domain